MPVTYHKSQFLSRTFRVNICYFLLVLKKMMCYKCAHIEILYFNRGILCSLFF